MSRSLNLAHLIGNVGQDPEVRSTTGGTRVATFSLATTNTWNDRDGNKKEQTQWHRIVVWGKLADIVEQYVHKGDKLYVAGRIEYRQWQDKDDQTRYTTEIRADQVIMLGAPKGAGDRPAREEHGDRVEREGMRGLRGRAPARSGGGSRPSDDFEDFPNALNDEDDDLPF